MNTTETIVETVDANGNVWSHVLTDHNTIAHYKNGQLVIESEVK